MQKYFPGPVQHTAGIAPIARSPAHHTPERSSMKITLTKAQISELFLIMGSKGAESSSLYEELKAIIKLYPRARADREFEIPVPDSELKTVRELLTPVEREITPERAFEEMRKDKKRQF